MDDAFDTPGLLVAVCSAGTKSSIVFALDALLGKERVEKLDCFLAGDDVDKKKPDPTIYRVSLGRRNPVFLERPSITSARVE